MMDKEVSPLVSVAAEQDVFVGRQPIYDRDLQVYGYELLFRSGSTNAAQITDGDAATFSVMLNALVEFGLGRLVGQHRAFVNLTKNSLLCEYPQFFAPHKVVLELLEDLEPDEDVVAAVRKYKEQGYRIALDDCVFEPHRKPLMDLADIIKIDLRALTRDELEEQVRLFEGFELLAEKVETPDEFEHCKQLGFDYFQGYFISKPKVVSVRRIPSNHLSVLRLLSQVYDPNVDTGTIATVIAQDAALSYRLLRAVNSAQYSLAVQVESITHAVSMLGLSQIRTWATLLSLAGMNDSQGSLLYLAMVRARTCENVGAVIDPGLRERCFMVGLFSLLDAIVGQPLQELMSTLSLMDEVVDALIEGDGFLGSVLSCAVACEQGDVENIACAGVPRDDIQSAYLDAIEWADEARLAMGV